MFFFSFLFSHFLLFVSVGMAWIVKLSGLTLAYKPLNGLHAHVRKMHNIQEVSCVKKCKSLHLMFFTNCQNRWLGTTPNMQTKFMLLFFGHKCLLFSLTCKSEFLQEIKKKKKKKVKKKERKKECLYMRQRDRKELDCMKKKKKKKGTWLYEAWVL